MQIDKYKIKVRGFTAELGEELDDTLRTLVTTEMDIESYKYVNKGENNEYDLVYNAKQNGVTIVKQSEEKVVKTKSKRSQSQKLRQLCWSDNPEESYYEWFTNGVIVHYDKVKELLNELNK